MRERLTSVPLYMGSMEDSPCMGCGGFPLYGICRIRPIWDLWKIPYEFRYGRRLIVDGNLQSRFVEPLGSVGAQ